eukprot:UN05353
MDIWINFLYCTSFFILFLSINISICNITNIFNIILYVFTSFICNIVFINKYIQAIENQKQKEKQQKRN